MPFEFLGAEIPQGQGPDLILARAFSYKELGIKLGIITVQPYIEAPTADVDFMIPRAQTFFEFCPNQGYAAGLTKTKNKDFARRLVERAHAASRPTSPASIRRRMYPRIPTRI